MVLMCCEGDSNWQLKFLRRFVTVFIKMLVLKAPVLPAVHVAATNCSVDRPQAICIRGFWEQLGSVQHQILRARKSWLNSLRTKSCVLTLKKLVRTDLSFRPQGAAAESWAGRRVPGIRCCCFVCARAAGGGQSRGRAAAVHRGVGLFLSRGQSLPCTQREMERIAFSLWDSNRVMAGVFKVPLC